MKLNRGNVIVHMYKSFAVFIKLGSKWFCSLVSWQWQHAIIFFVSRTFNLNLDRMQTNDKQTSHITYVFLIKSLISPDIEHANAECQHSDDCFVPFFFSNCTKPRWYHPVESVSVKNAIFPEDFIHWANDRSNLIGK